jgi:PAS domain S-box-containing protein
LTEAEQVARRRRSAQGPKQAARPDGDAPALASAWIDASPVFVALLDAGGRIVEVNRTLLEALGCSADSVTGADFLATAIPEGERQHLGHAFAEAGKTSQPFVVESPLGADAIGASRVEWHGGPLLDSSGRLEGITLVGVGLGPNRRGEPRREGPAVEAPGTGDESLREIQERLIDAERLGAAGELAACVAHAVHNPLAALLGTAQMAWEASRVQDPVLHRVIRLGQRIQRVVDRTLQMFREEELTLREEDPGQILQDAAQELDVRGTGQGVRVSVRVEPDLTSIRADRKQLSGALVRVGENALEAMQGKGKLDLEVFALSHFEGVSFRITDTGPGFTDVARRRAFEPFFTTKGGTAGLGLPIARGVIVGHQGRIQLEDRPGGGAVVSIELPARPGVLLA